MRFQYVAFLSTAFLCIAVTVAAQDSDCAPIVQRALASVTETCVDIGRNQACYGNSSIEATLTDDEMTFEVGSVIDIEHVETMTLEPFNADPEVWGVALLAVQANLTDEQLENVTFLLFGDTEFSTGSQAYYFSSSAENESCAEAPNGILIQTPEGVGEINLLINEVDIRLGSTAYLTAEADGLMSIALLEGAATISIDDTEVTVEAGMFSTIELDEDLNPVSEPAEPQPIDEALADTLPLGLLPDDITAETGDAASDGAIISPLSGEWTATPVDVIGIGDCSSSTLETYQSVFTDVLTNQLEFTDPFDFRAYIESQSGGELPPEMVFDNPEPNFYTYSLPTENFIVAVEMRIISPTLIENMLIYDYAPSGENCVIEASFIFDRVGD